MPRPKSSRPATAAPSPACGPMMPTSDDVPITEVDTPEKIWSMVQIACDNDTGVFFFRHQRRMYLRYVEIE